MIESREIHVGRLVTGGLILCFLFFLSGAASSVASEAGYHWAIGAFGIYLAFPVAYLLGTILDKTGLVNPKP